MSYIGSPLVFMLIAALPLRAADKWIRLSTPNFELYTNTSEAAGKEVVQQFEQLRTFFDQLPDYHQPQLAPIRVVQFSSVAQFTPYKSVDWEAGHYESNGSRDWIALGPASSPEFRGHLLAHEYHHLVAGRAGMRLPRWFSEGLADFFSTLMPAGGKTQVGGLLPSHLEILRRGNRLSLDALISKDKDAFQAMKPEEAHSFYAESWLLTHLLATKPEYRPNFRKFITALNEGRSSLDAFQTAFGRSSDSLEKDLREYLEQGKVALLLPERADAAAVGEIGVAATSEFEVSLVMTDLLAVMGKDDAAKTALERLNGQFSALQEIRNAPEERAPALAGMYFHLARIGWRQKQATDRTFTTLESILELPQVRRVETSRVTSIAEMYYQFALIAREAGASREKVKTAFSRALELQPGHLDARVKLGEFCLEGEELSAAVAAFTQIPPTSKAAGYALNGLHGVAAGYLNADKFQEARETVENGRQWIRTLADTAATEKLLVYIAQRAAAFHLRTGDLSQARADLDRVRTFTLAAADREEIERLRALVEARSKGKYAARPKETLLSAQGTAIALECPATGPLLRVRSDEKEMKFDLPDPSAVEVNSSGTVAVDLRCGKLEPFRIVVEYASPGATSPASAGVIRRMKF